MATETLAPRFDAKVLSAQSTFRAIMDATARPGRVQRIVATADAPAPLMPATAALAQALFDHDTLFWRDAAMRGDAIAQWLRFHTGAPLTDAPDKAAFALIGDIAALPPLDAFALGTPDYPDRSTTLIVQAESIAEGAAYELRGPGIKGATMIHVDPRLCDLLAALAANEQTFPRGIDVVLVAGDSLLAIPRTARLRAIEA